MSRKNRNKRQQQRQQQARPGNPAAPPQQNLEESAAEIEAANRAAYDDATEADLAEAAEAPELSQNIDLVKSAREASDAVRVSQATKRRYQEMQEALASQQQELDERDRALEAAEKELAERQSESDAKSQQLKRLEDDLAEREDAVKRKELEAEASFTTRFAEMRRESLDKLELELASSRAELDQNRKLIADERAAWAAERSAERGELDGEISEKRRELRRLQTEAQVEHEMLEENRDILELRVQKLAEIDREQTEARERDLHERLESAREERDRLAAELRRREEAQRALGNEPLEETKRRLDMLIQERENLKAELATRVSADEQARLEQVVRAHEASETARTALAQENAELKAQLNRYTIAVTELETLRDQKAALEHSRDLLHAAVEELNATVDDRIRRSDGVSPFPQCMAMDSDEVRQTSASLHAETINLKDFAEDLRDRIAEDPDTGKVLYYSERDIRSFLGGMAMSKLHLLQGISGTGKTSLPIAAARALGAGLRLVEVQAGWRDRHDLIGHFNEFEKRFYETEFLQALYEAQCPQYRDRPYIVVLDEMNLSHPEQYFADLLSALELDQPLQKIDLMTAPVEPAPDLLVEGRTLRVPPNVWFMGTANHDETTMGFADKTYDRSHTMELPRHREEFEPAQRDDRMPISVGALQRAFDAARTDHEDDAGRAYDFLVDSLSDDLGRRFGVGWGNRLERQMTAYVPVVIAAGGTIGEAVDHIISTKLLRKIRDRHDNQTDDLAVLRDTLRAAWPKLEDETDPDRSMDIITDELHRLDGDDG